MSRYCKPALAIVFLLFLYGCEQNKDIALLSSYPLFGSCAIDSPTQNEAFEVDQEFTVSGWAFDEKNKSVPDTLTLYFINESTSQIFTFPARRTGGRPDVAAAYKLPNLVDSGFSGLVTKNVLSPGSYRIVLLQASRGTGVISCAGETRNIRIQ